MAENIWAALSNQLAEASASVGQSVVAVHGGSMFPAESYLTKTQSLRRAMRCDAMKISRL